jgi:hypothetical protein
VANVSFGISHPYGNWLRTGTGYVRELFTLSAAKGEIASVALTFYTLAFAGVNGFSSI